jgi:hypothetical protein
MEHAKGIRLRSGLRTGNRLPRAGRWYLVKVDRQTTQLLRANGFFLDRRSYLTMPDAESATVHLVLLGEDLSAQRNRVYMKQRGICKVCKKQVFIDSGEYHHTRGIGQRCDCLPSKRCTGVEFRHRECHQHRTPGFKRVARG